MRSFGIVDTGRHRFVQNFGQRDGLTQRGRLIFLCACKSKDLLDHGSKLVGMLDDERSEEHTSELQSQSNLVCRLLLEKKKKTKNTDNTQKQPLYASTHISTYSRP